VQIMSKIIVNDLPWARISPGRRWHSVVLPGDYAYTSIWSGEISGASCSSAGWRRGWSAGVFSRGLRCGRRCLRAVDDGAGVTGLMLSIVSISICLKLQLLIVCIGSLADILARMISRGSLRAWIWLSTGWLCENQPAITGLH
jgi:hypothetical protein